MYYRTQGFIIKKFNFRENDEILTIYTKDFGKIDFISRGGKKMLAKLTPYLQVFNLVELEFVEGKNFKTITSAINLMNFDEEKKDLFKLRIFNDTFKIIDKLFVEPQTDERVWEFLVNFYTLLGKIKIEDKESLKKLVLFFEGKILKMMGHL